MLFFTSLSLFSSTCPFVKLFLTATYCCLPRSLLPHCPLPLASLAVRDTGGGACSPGMQTSLHLQKAATEAGQPLHLTSPRAKTGRATHSQRILRSEEHSQNPCAPSILPSAHPSRPVVCCPAHSFPPFLARPTSPTFFPCLLFYLIPARDTSPFP